MPSPKFEWKNFELLSKYGTDLTRKAEKGELEPAMCREREIELVMQILCKRRKNNPCILGSPGIGLTSIVEGLAQRIVNGLAPPQFLGKKVIAIKKNHMFAGCELEVASQVEQRLNALIVEMKQTEGMVILFVDEVNLLMLLGDKTDQCIGALTKKEYQTYIESNTTLRERYQSIDVPEPSIEETLQALKVLQLQYGEHHKVDYSDEALVAVARLSSHCHSNGYVLDKAIDMMDEAGARVSLEKTRSSRVVTKEDITYTLNYKHVGLSEGNSFNRTVRSQGKSRSLLNMMESLRKHIIGQEEAIEALSCALLRARAGIRDHRRPIASFIFTGPTGVGKTALANAIAIEYFGSMEHVLKLDMSEYKESHSVSKLFGSPPGYTGYDDGGQLTKAVKKQPETVIIFDEVEKAHPDVFNSLLQVLEDGTLTDSKGVKSDFTKSIIIFTSNIGHNLNEPDLKKQVMEQLNKFFRLELLNRFDDIIVFKQITNSDDLKKVLEIMLIKVYERLKEKKIDVDIQDCVKDKLIKEGNDPIYGVRPLRRCITRLIEDALAQGIVDGDVQERDSLIIDLDTHGNVIIKASCSSLRNDHE